LTYTEKLHRRSTGNIVISIRKRASTLAKVAIIKLQTVLDSNLLLLYCLGYIVFLKKHGSKEQYLRNGEML